MPGSPGHAAAGGMTGPVAAGMGMGAGHPIGGMPNFDNSTLSGACREIAALTGFTHFAQNETMVQMVAKMIPLTDEEVKELKGNATIAADQLKTLQANETLASTCATVNSVTQACMRYQGLMQMEDIAQNQTKLDNLQMRRNLTNEQVAQLKQFAEMNVNTLDAMNHNVTLVTQCTALRHSMMGGMPEAESALMAVAHPAGDPSSSVPMEQGATQPAPGAKAPGAKDSGAKDSGSKDSGAKGSGGKDSAPAAMPAVQGITKAAKASDQKNSASSIAMSSFVVLAGVAASIVLLA